MMKIIATNDKAGDVLAQMSKTDWLYLQRAAGIAHDRRSYEVGAQADAKNIDLISESLAAIKGLRKDMGQNMKKWDALAERVDSILDQK